MRETFRDIAEHLVDADDRVTILLGDIGVHAFRESMERCPNRVINVGVLEQATIGIAAGFALEGMIPFVHSIAPFLIERTLEQIKVDFGYQELGVNLVSVGASLDYAALGCTHHAPGDVGALLTIPGVQVFLPGTQNELRELMVRTYDNGRLSYFRLSEQTNSISVEAPIGRAVEIVPGGQVAVLAIGPTLDMTLGAVQGLNVAVLYLNSIDSHTGQDLARSLSDYRHVFVVEPYYRGTTLQVLDELLSGSRVSIHCLGLPRAFRREYGSVSQHLEAVGLTEQQLRKQIENLAST